MKTAYNKLKRRNAILFNYFVLFVIFSLIPSMIRSGPDFIYNIASDSKDVTQTSLELSYFIYAFIFYNCGLIVAWGFEKIDGYKHSNSTFTFLSIALTFVSFVAIGIGFIFISIVHPFSFRN
jgi:hypothetical protein